MNFPWWSELDKAHPLIEEDGRVCVISPERNGTIKKFLVEGYERMVRWDGCDHVIRGSDSSLASSNEGTAGR